MGGQSSEAGDTEFPGPHFQKDLFVLALGSSQMDLFGDAWLDVMVRVYWLKARFLALQVHSLVCLRSFFLFWLVGGGGSGSTWDSLLAEH